MTNLIATTAGLLFFAGVVFSVWVIWRGWREDKRQREIVKLVKKERGR